MQQLSASNSKIVGLSAFAEYQLNFVSEQLPLPPRKVPHSLTKLYSEQNKTIESEEFSTHCTNIINKMIISDDEIDYVEEMSRSQRTSTVWHEQRAGRITASMAHKFLHTSLSQPAKSYIKKVCHPNINNTETKVPALRYGIENEIHAFNLYEYLVCGKPLPEKYPIKVQIDTRTHHNISVKNCGLYLCKDAPYLGASPDGVIECDCCGIGVLEIKCPFKFKSSGLDDVPGNKEYCISSDMKLKQTHEYYTQVQHQMFVLNCQYADFFIWSPINAICIRVQRDEDFIKSMITKLSFIWEKHILPELLTHNIKDEDVSKESKRRLDTVYCLCKTSTDLDDMVGCDRCNDWFHPKCLKLKGLPNTKVWYCPACRKNKKKK